MRFATALVAICGLLAWGSSSGLAMQDLCVVDDQEAASVVGGQCYTDNGLTSACCSYHIQSGANACYIQNDGCTIDTDESPIVITSPTGTSLETFRCDVTQEECTFFGPGTNPCTG